ncbi:MAG TPA: hypothetical protein VFZ62_00210 [Candidatus Saccharimonadales bacterium]
MAVRQTYLFDEGPDGASPAISGDIIEVNGATYTGGSKDGPFALLGSGVGTQYIGIANSGTINHSGSVYVKPGGQPTGSNRFVNITTSQLAIVVAIRIHSDGHFDVTNGATRAGVTSFSWVADQWYRVDWQFNQTVQASPVFTVRFFVDPDATVPNETLSFTGSGAPGNMSRWRIGLFSSAGASAAVTLDTFRVADGLEWIGPYSSSSLTGKGKVWDAASSTWKTFTPKAYSGGVAVPAKAKVWDAGTGTWKVTKS